MKVLKSNY